MQIQFDH